MPPSAQVNRFSASYEFLLVSPPFCPARRHLRHSCVKSQYAWSTKGCLRSLLNKVVWLSIAGDCKPSPWDIALCSRQNHWSNVLDNHAAKESSLSDMVVSTTPSTMCVSRGAEQRPKTGAGTSAKHYATPPSTVSETVEANRTKHWLHSLLMFSTITPFLMCATSDPPSLPPLAYLPAEDCSFAAPRMFFDSAEVVSGGERGWADRRAPPRQVPSTKRAAKRRSLGVLTLR